MYENCKKQCVKILLCIVIVLTICQRTQSWHISAFTSENATYHSNNKDSIVVQASDYYDPEDENPRVAGGYYASLGQFPYIVVVHQLLGNGRIGQCGGTILSKRWVLTAGHCAVKYPRRFKVIFGSIDKTDNSQGLWMTATQAFVHPYYKESHNDIALLYMPHDITFSNTIQPVELASGDVSFANKNAYVVGWGKDSMDSYGTTKLKYATLPIIRNNECRKTWHISDKHVCTAAGLGRDACQGDSGGPLVVKENGKVLQVGIVSYGDASCPSNLPGVFTRVSSYIDWIYAVTKLSAMASLYT